MDEGCPPNMSYGKLKKVDLPAELWARVAAHMSLRDWARASGTCRSTKAVCLKNLTIKNIPAAGVQWASRMLDTADVLCSSAHSLRPIAQGVMSGLYSIKQLQQLVIDAHPCSDSLLSCLSWLLAQTCKLEILVTRVDSSPWFPSLTTLKHLILTFHGDAGNFCDAVPTCTALETLSLHSLGRYGSEVLRMGMLEMDGLPHLRVLVLKAIVPESIKVPKACQVHIGVSPTTDMQNSMWQCVLANIHALKVDLPMPDTASVDLFWKRILSPLQNLRILDMHVCTAQPVLYLKPFAQIEKLRISGQDLDLYFPAGVSWDTVEVDATGSLELDFEDLSGFPLAVPRFAARYGVLRSTQTLQLCATVALYGIECTYWRKKHWKSMFWYPVGQRPCECWCGACLDCLVASGQAVDPNMHCSRHPLHVDVDDGVGGQMGINEEELSYGDDIFESSDEDEEEDL
ncbi:hypothetical protein COCOBI_07-1460 [Coccomyxa sp. Obi]|nr:hypothetical protein COCOBI_07-1460 [Coccomyxa sp. Obi]